MIAANGGSGRGSIQVDAMFPLGQEVFGSTRFSEGIQIEFEATDAFG